MAVESTSLWLAPTCCSYKNGDIILNTAMISNVNDKNNLKHNKKTKPTINFNTKYTNNDASEILMSRYHNIANYKRQLFTHQLLNYTESQGVLFIDFSKSSVFQNNYKITKLKYVTPFNIHKHNLTIYNSGSNSRVKKSFSDTLHSKHFYTTSNPYSKLSWKVYRCQLSSQEESCCCSCNSDAMFEVMKSLYDCYKKKNCDNCNCILCGHLPREERRLGELRKSGVEKAVGKTETFSRKKLKSKASLAIDYKGKSLKEKEQILKEMAVAGKPLPVGMTKSEKDLIRKVRTELGLPPEPVNSADKKKMSEAYKAGLIRPLEGKTFAEKEKILKKQAAVGIPLPEGRTPSEKALIAKVKETMLKAKEDGLLTPLESKSKQEKERILKGLTKQGLPLPEPKTESDQKLMDRIRNEVGLPPEPKTPSGKEKYDRAMAAGLITPLDGKSLGKKEQILRDQVRMGLQLPEGRTPSEKALIAKIKETTRPEKEVRLPSEKISKAKAQGLLTPLEGKSKKAKENILKGLAKQGLPFPVAKTASDQKLMDRIRYEVGLPPEPKTPSAKKKYDRAMAAGLITPLESKSLGKREKILSDQVKMGLQLPEGRTPSEKALIAKIKETTRPEKEMRLPSEKIRKAKAQGLLTPLEGKSKTDKENILKGLAKQGIPFPVAKTASDQKLMDRIRNEVGLPPEPKTPSAKEKYDRAMAAGLITPLEGKSLDKKQQILRDQAKMGLQLPEGRTPSEKALIAKIKETTRPEKEVRLPSEKIRKAKAQGLLTPLEGKSKTDKENILKGLAKQGIPFPVAKSASDQKLMDRIRNEVGLPPEPKTPSAKEKYDRAMAAGLITPLEGKSLDKKEQILRDQAKMGLVLPQGRTPSEKALIEKVKATSPYLKGRPALTPEKIHKLDTSTAKVMKEKKGPSDECICDLLTPESVKVKIGFIKMPTKKDTPIKVPSEKLRKAKGDGLLTPLQGKSTKEKERILRGLVKHGIPLPEAKTASEQKLMNRIRNEVGLPPEPKTPSAKEKYDRAMAAGLITPLEGKSLDKKQQILRDQVKMGLQLPEGRTPSEKALIAKIKETTRPEKEVRLPSEKIRKAKAQGLLTPLEGKSKKAKENILKGLAKQGLPFPVAKTASDQKLMDRIRYEVGLPPEPKTPSAKEKYDRAMAAGLITPLESKSLDKREKILRDQVKMGLQLPEGRTPSEKALIAKIKETTRPEKEMRLPSEKIRKAQAQGLLTPLDGKSEKAKENILKGLAKQGIPFPVAKTASDQKLMDRIRNEVGLPPEPKTPSAKEKYDRAMAAGIITPLEGKSLGKREKILRDQVKMGLQLPEGRTPSEKALIAKIKETTRPEKEVRLPSEKIRKAKAQGLLTPLEGKSKKAKENILKGLAKQGLPFPVAKTASDQKLMDRIRNEVGLPPEPKTPSAKEKYDRAMAAGLITPLSGKSLGKKEQILRDQVKMGLQLPEGRTPSEKALIAKIKETTRPEKEVRLPSEKLRIAKAQGLLTPLEGKSKKAKENILKGLAKQGIPFPVAKTASDQKLMDRIRNEVGLPPEPKTPSAKEKYDRAMAAGLITPLDGKSLGKKEQILRDQVKMGLQLPEGRTPSEKALIAKIKETTRPEKEVRLPSEKIRIAKAQGLLTPLEGKSKKAKENILKGLAKQGLPFPVAKTASDKKLMDRIRNEVGLPPEPKTSSAKEKYDRAMAAGLITPLDGKSLGKKEQILRDQVKMGLELPEGRTPSEKALIAKIKETNGPEKELRLPSERIRTAKAQGLLTPLEGKSKKAKENILKGLAKQGLPFPVAKSASDQKLMDRIRNEVGLPPEPKTPSAKEKYNRAMAAGLITPLEGKSLDKKEQILRDQAKMGLVLPQGRTPSEKALIEKVKGTSPYLKGRPALTPEKINKLDTSTAKVMKEKKGPSDECICDLLTPESEKVKIGFIKMPTKKDTPIKVPSEKLRKAKGDGLLTPLQGKSTKEKERILRGLVKHGIPLPEAKTASEQKLMNRIRNEVGLPPEPKTPSAKEKYDRAMAAGLITPLEGKSLDKKQQILRDQVKMGLQLPEGRTPSEKALIAKIKETTRPEIEVRLPSEKIRIAKAQGLLTPLEGKSKKAKENILKGLAKQGLPFPVAESVSDQKLMDRIRYEVGLPPEPKTPSAKKKYDRAMAAGLITPLEGKSLDKKEQILRHQAKMGLPLPEGRTTSEKALIAKVRATTKKEVSLAPSEIPIIPETASQKEILKKAKVAGILTPLKGKSHAQKEKILKGLADAGLPIPEGTTPSEKVLVQKVRAMAGLPEEITPSEKKGKIKQRSKKIGVGGIIEELEDISKTTTCDKGCGCDKKKIRFKHSYVKIRVTSPDISSLCPCPEECIPGVKGGVFTDNEGIKVTIGRATGVPVFPSREFRELETKIRSSDITCSRINNHLSKQNVHSSQHNYTSNIEFEQTKNLKSYLYDSSPLIKANANFYKDHNIRIIKSFPSYYEKPLLLRNEATKEFYSSEVSNSSSLETIYLLKSDSCLSLTTASEVYSVISFSVTGTSSYSDYNIREDDLNMEYEQIIKSNENSTVHCTSDSALSIMNVYSTITYWTSKILANNHENKYEREILRLKCIQSASSQSEYLRYQRRQRFIMNFNNRYSNSEIFDNVSEVLSKISFDDSSTVIVLLPSSSNESAADKNNHYLDVLDSCVVVKVSEHYAKRNHTHDLQGLGRNKGIKFTDGKILKDVPSIEKINKNEWCGNGSLHEKHDNTASSQIMEHERRFFSTDTTEDRPCCCTPIEGSEVRGLPSEERKSEKNNVPELAKSMIPKEAVARVNITCSACERSKWDDTSSKKAKSRTEDKSSCPCSFGNKIDPSQDTKDTWKEKSIIQKEKKKNKRSKKLKCECAQELTKLLPEFQFAEEDWIDDAQVRKINSDLTQAVSGFKFNVLRKKPQQETSFEEILKLYADSFEQKYKNLNYVNNGKLQTETKAANCVCPAEQQDTSASKVEEQLQGIKFHIGGKGSGSKGLTGILCF